MKNNTLTLATKDFASIIDTLQAHAKALHTSVEYDAHTYKNILEICYTVYGYDKNDKRHYEAFSITYFTSKHWKERCGASQISSMHYYHNDGDGTLNVHYIDNFDRRQPDVTVKYE